MLIILRMANLLTLLTPNSSTAKNENEINFAY